MLTNRPIVFLKKQITNNLYNNFLFFYKKKTVLLQDKFFKNVFIKNLHLLLSKMQMGNYYLYTYAPL